MDTHGLDLAAIEAASGGHSIFAPSGSAMWLTCSGSLIPNILAPDTAGIDAAYGTVGHHVAETWLKAIQSILPKLEAGEYDTMAAVVDWCEPNHLIGTTQTVHERDESFVITIDEEMLGYVRRYVEWCVALPGDHYVETRVDFSQLTPIPNQGGTADHGACEPGVLTITDLKMGMERVDAVFEDRDSPQTIIDLGDRWTFNGNPQALIYALGFFFAWDWFYDFQRIVIRIAQPRLDHFDVWETTREELLQFAEFVRARASAAWAPNAPRTPSPKGCRWCKVKGSCPAKAAWAQDLVDGVFDPVTDEDGFCASCEGAGCGACAPVIDATYTVQDMAVRADMIVSGKTEMDPRDPCALSNEALGKLLPYRKAIEAWFEAMHEEAVRRALDGETIPGHKLVQSAPGKRAWRNEDEAVEWLGAVASVDPERLYKKVLISPAQAEEIVRRDARVSKKEAASLLDSAVTRPPGRHTLVPEKDRRDALEAPGDLFEDWSTGNS